MPRIEEFKDKKQNLTAKKNKKHLNGKATPHKASVTEDRMSHSKTGNRMEHSVTPKRRPGHDGVAKENKLKDEHNMKKTAPRKTEERVEPMDSAPVTPMSADHSEDYLNSVHEEGTKNSTFDQEAKTELDFPGKELLKSYAPKAFRSIEIIAEDWKKNGSFEGLPVGHPLLQVLASKGLQRAKAVEKKLEQRGVFMIARMGVDMVKSKVNDLRGKKTDI